MPTRYKFFEKVKEPNTNFIIPGFMNEDLLEKFHFEDDMLYTIPKTLEFRPDLIAYNFWKDSVLSYILIYANRIDDSPEGFYAGRKIRVPRYERIINLI